jgi:hypothetical protein
VLVDHGLRSCAALVGQPLDPRRQVTAQDDDDGVRNVRAGVQNRPADRLSGVLRASGVAELIQDLAGLALGDSHLAGQLLDGHFPAQHGLVAAASFVGASTGADEESCGCNEQENTHVGLRYPGDGCPSLQLAEQLLRPGRAVTTPDPGGQDGGGGETREPIGNLIASPDNGLCDFVPGGTTDGRDALQVSFFILLIGANPGDLPGLVKVDGESSTGATASYRSAVSNQARSVAAIPLSGQDFGAQLTVTITVDTPDEVPETDESDNRITASVRVPSPRPSGAVELPCTLNRA